MSKIKNGNGQKIECVKLAGYIADMEFDEAYIILYVPNPAYAPIVLRITDMLDNLSGALDYAIEGSRFMVVDIWDRNLYLQCGQHPPDNEPKWLPYTKHCPICHEPKMRLTDYRPGQHEDDKSTYQCDNCLSSVNIQVVPFIDEELEGDM